MDTNWKDGRALLSVCGDYRYLLSRRWGTGGQMLFIMLNPSTADGLTDDATIRKCMGFARRAGCGSISVVNLYAYRATVPSRMFAAEDPVGPDNDAHIIDALKHSSDVMCAWGNHARQERVQQVKELIRQSGVKAWALKINANGSPAHPLMLSYDRDLVEYN